MLWCGVIGGSTARSPPKEELKGKRRRVGDIEEEGRVKGRTLIANDEDNNGPLWSIEGGLYGTTNAPGIMALCQFIHPPLPAPLTTNIGISHTMESLH